MFIDSSVAGLLVAFLDELQVVVDSRVFRSGQSTVSFVSPLWKLGFPHYLSLISSALISHQIVTWLFDIMLSGLSYQQLVLLHLPVCRRSVFCLCAYSSSLLCPVFYKLCSVPLFAVHPCPGLSSA
ncbi:unnamed protein product [Heterobilharzia americana]|nr:unnamed protein product [Heterobilharzia americana]